MNTRMSDGNHNRNRWSQQQLLDSSDNGCSVAWDPVEDHRWEPLLQLHRDPGDEVGNSLPLLLTSVACEGGAKFLQLLDGDLVPASGEWIILLNILDSFEWIFFWMNILDFVLNWILNWIIFRPNSMKKWIFKTYRTGLVRPGPCPFSDSATSFETWQARSAGGY